MTHTLRFGWWAAVAVSAFLTVGNGVTAGRLFAQHEPSAWFCVAATLVTCWTTVALVREARS